MNRLAWVSIFIALIIGGRATAQQTARSGDGSRAITGRVINHNGQPLADEKVFVEKVGGSSNFLSASTNDSGEFRFDNLSPGVYMLYVPGGMDEDRRQVYRPGDFVTVRVKKGGVITGTVTNSTGEPLITARVKITRVRDRHGRRVDLSSLLGLGQTEDLTDDRGVYRFWGLEPGSYLVSTGRGTTGPGRGFPYATDDDAPTTYHPSSARPDAATEVSVDEGREATGIDIRVHSETGYAISGYVSGQVAGGPGESGVMVRLTHAPTGAPVGWQMMRAAEGSNSFAFEGLADGEYDVMALHLSNPANFDAASPLRRVVVKGKDVTGLEVKLLPLGSIEGRVVLEADRKPRCRGKNVMRPDEIAIIAGRERADPPLPVLALRMLNARGAMAVPDQKGDFMIHFLQAERYRVETQLPSEDWYIHSVDLPGPATPKLIDAGRDGIAVKSGERVTGLTITAREGAASLRGRVVMAQANAALPARLRAHLVPSEREQSDNVLRFAEAEVQSDGSFLLTNIAPGRYWLLARPSDDVPDDSARPVAWDREARAKLTREAAATNISVELQPCQRISNHVMRYLPPGAKR